MNTSRNSGRGPARRFALLWLAGAGLLAVPGCSQPQTPAPPAQAHQDVAGGAIPAGALQKYTAAHPNATPPPGGPATKPPGP